MNIVFDISNALESLYPEGANYIQEGFNYSGLTWLDKIQSQPTEAEIDAEVIRLQAEWDSQEYARNRKTEYDALNQFEMQYDDKEDGTTTWEDAIAAIKTKYPKG